MAWLTALFFVVALVYASVGFGGGSTYTALLGLWGVNYALIPSLSLMCNIIVVGGGSWRFYRAGLIDCRAFAPLLLVSAPLAFAGGLVPLKQDAFLLLLGTLLLLSCLALLLQPDRWKPRTIANPFMLLLSAIVGLLAGLSGIGGGIFMAPVLHLVRWSDARRIAAFSSVYILINSIAGLAGQMAKNGTDTLFETAAAYWPAMLAVLLGGQIGGMVGLHWFAAATLRRVTAVLVGYVALRLLGQALGL